MANSCRLLNYLDPEGDYIRFYTELNMNVEIGDKVFIVGGNYDNSIYTDKTNSLYNPFHQYATGYTVISVDQTALSNAITLNIKFGDSSFNSGGIETIIFDPKPVYKTEDELLIEPNQVREAYISKTYFKKGEFNGGKFQDGIFGEFNIKGESSNKTYQRQHFVDLLRAKSVALDDLATVNAIDAYDYSTLESPVNNNKAKFNNNFDNQPAQWTGGVFLGGDMQWGEWKSKTSPTTVGKLQTLNENFGIKNILDNSKYNIQVFSDNNGGVGYSQFVSGNFARIFSGDINIKFDAVNKSIILSTIPYVIKKSYENNFDIQLRITTSVKNNRTFDVVYNGTNSLVLKDIQIFGNNFSLAQELYDEDAGEHNIEIYIKDKADKPARFSTGRVLSADWFGGVFTDGSFEGGDWHWGELRTGSISTTYQHTNWNDGVFNGSVDEAYAENLRWFNGNWVNGNWKGDSVVPVKGITYDTTGYIKIDVHTSFKQLFKIGEKTYLSYFKKGITNSYLNNYTDKIGDFIINSQAFNLIDIVESDSLYKATLILEGKLNLDILKDINLQYAKVSQSFFKKGIWRNGIWESGLREVDNYKIQSYDAGTNFLDNKQMQVTLDTIDNLSIGDKVEVSNFNLVRDIDVEYLEDVVSLNNNRPDQEYLQSLDLTLTVIDITSGTAGNLVLLAFPINSSSGEIDLPEISGDLGGFTDDGLKRIDLIDTENGKTEFANCLWLNGEFRSGAWQGGLWKQGTFSNFLYFDNINTQLQSVWQSGYWKQGTFENGVFLSGLWQDGTWNNGIMTNLFDNTTPNNETFYSSGDSVWLNGTFANGTWRRGLFKQGKVLNGTIVNGGIKSIEWYKGQYTNGFGEFYNTNNVNKTGNFTNGKNEYDSLSAPSLIYIDKNGWAQLDQPSFYQKGYNIIFQDLDLHGDNPFNNQLFTVKNRDLYGTRLRIDNSTSGDNPLLNSSSLPILAIDNIVDIVEMGTSGNLWIADSGNKRILEVNQNTGLVDVLGKVIGDSTRDKFNFTDIKFMFKGTAFVYVVDGSTVKLINESKDNVVTMTPGLLSGEVVIDMWVASQNEILNEVVYLLTNLGNIYYWMPMWTAFKSVSILTYTVDVPVSFVGVRPSQSSRTHLMVNVLTNGISKMKYAILDYSFGNLTYTLTSIIDTTPTFKDVTVEGADVNKINKIVASYNSGKFDIWLLTSDYTSTDQNIYKMSYDYTTNTFDADGEKLNSDVLNYPVSRFRLGLNSEYLTIVGMLDTYNVYFSKAKIDKSEFGLGDPQSTIKLFDIHQTLTDNVKYWIYDDEPNSKRIIYITESSDPENFYNSDLSDTLNADTDVVRFVSGETTNVVYAIVKISTDTTEEYKIRKVNNSKVDIENDITNDNTFTFTVIYDGIFVKDTLYIIANDGSSVKIFSVSPSLVVSLTSFSTPFSVFTGSGFKIAGVEDGNDIILMVYEEGVNRMWEAKVGSTITNIQYDSLSSVVDIALAKTSDFLHLYLAYANRVVRTVSDKSISGHYSWTDNIKDVVYNGGGIEEIVKTEFNQIVVRYGIDFDMFDVDYTTTNKTVEEVVIRGTDEMWAISNNTIIEINQSTSGYNVLQGKYRQVSRPNIFTASLNNNDTILGSPKSLILASTFGGGDYLYFIDDFEGSYNIIRRINVATYATNIETFGSDRTKDMLDLSYDYSNNRLYVLYKDGANINVGYLSTVNGSMTILLTGTTNYSKVSIVNDGGTIYIALLQVLTSTSQVLIYNTAGTLINTLPVSTTVSDISFIINNTSVDNKYQIFLINDLKVLNLLSNATLTGLWTKKSVGIKVNTINEKLDTNDVIYVDGSQSVNYIKISGARTEERLSIRDMGFVTLTNKIFFYNNPQIGNGGVTREVVPANLADGIDLSLTSQIDNVTGVDSSSFKKMVAISDNVVYGLFENGIYEYNFLTNTSIKLNTPLIEYRDTLNQTPDNINTLYQHTAVDISMVDGSVIAIFEVCDSLNIGLGKYNVYKYNGTDFEILDYLYFNNTESITTDGGTDGFVYPASTGGIKYLFTSVIDPKIFGKVESTIETVFLYFKESVSGTDTFLKIVEKSQVEIINNSQFGDLVFKLTIPGFDKTIETATTATISPNPLDNTLSSLSSSSFSDTYGSITTNNNQKIITFTKPSNVIFEIFDSYNISVKFNTTLATNPSSYTSVYDFRVYKNGTSDKIFIRETSNDYPINTSISDNGTNNGAWELIRNVEGEWTVNNILTSNDLDIRSLIKASPSVTINLATVLTNNNTIQLNLLDIPFLDKSYNFDSFNGIDRGYKVINTRGNQILSPYVTGRVLYDTIINNDVSFNANGTAESGHVVSTTWKNGLFVGSWDAPTYIDYTIISKYSLFVGGIFEGKFYDGFFLGGTFRNPVNSESILMQGHFMSDGSNINWESGKIQSNYRYDIHNIEWNDVNNGVLKVLVQGLTYDGDDYTPQTPINIAPGTLVQIPSLFKNNEIIIEEISRGVISMVDGKDEIILKVLEPEYYNESLWIGNKIFISSPAYSEYLFGEFIVNHSYVSNGYLYLIINSKFKNFDSNGIYSPVIKPKILIGFYNRIISKNDLGNGFTEYEISLPVPTNIENTLNTYADKLKLVKSYYINDNIDVLLYGDYIGNFTIPNYLQMFSFTFNKTYNNVALNFNSVATNLYLNNIISDDNSSYVSVNLGTATPSLFAIDIMVNNSYITSTNVNNWIEESIFLSGRTDRRWVSGAWLNKDNKGFSNGKSQFGNATMLPIFEGEPTKIIDIEFEGIEYLWVQLDNVIQNVDKFRYITLRGFTGNKSNLIGSTRSNVFRIQEVDSNWIKIKNPFKYYYGLNSTNNSPYLKDFNVDELQIQKQSMVVKDASIGSDVKINSNGTNFLFEYGWASVSAWNGGDFYGTFNSVWNAGNFMSGNFNGKWFGSPESPNWQGEISLNVEDLGNKFLLTLTEFDNFVREQDLVYVKFNSTFNNTTLIDTLEGFYGAVQLNGTSGLMIQYTTNTYLNAGNYPVNITRYRVDYKNTNPYILEDNTLIVDYNVNLSSTNNVNMHTYMERIIGATSGGLVINFNGDNSVATGDLVNLALNGGNDGEMTIDFAFKYNTILEGDVMPLFGFHNTETLHRTGFKCYIKKVSGVDTVYLEYQLAGDTAVIELQSDPLSSSTWNHMSLFINSAVDATSLKYIINAFEGYKDISKWDSFDGIVNYDLNLIGQSIFVNSNKISSSYFIGQLDEIRVWNKDMHQYFLAPSLFQDKRFINGYIPQIVAYFSGENYEIDNGKYFPKEENYFAFDNEFTKVDTLPYYSIKNAIYDMDILVQQVSGAFKILTLEEERYSGFKYIVELFGVDNEAASSGKAGTYSFKVKETIVIGNNISVGSENYYTIPCEMEYWKWNKMILTENGIYIDGVLVPNSKIPFINRNIFKQNIKVKVSLGNTPYSTTSSYLTDSQLFVNGVSPTWIRGFVKTINIFENTNTKEDYIIYRILSPENIDDFAVTESLVNNISATTSSLVKIPNFNLDGSMSWDHFIYNTENYYSAVSALGDNIVYNNDIRDTGSIIPSDFDSNLRFIDTVKISTAMPANTWLEGTDFISFNSGVVDDVSVSATIKNMSNFELFGKKCVADTSGNVKMKISSNGLLTLTQDPVANDYFNAYSANDADKTTLVYKKMSSIDIIYMMFTDLYISTGTKWEYADRDNELIIRYYVNLFNDNSTISSTPANYVYFALRIDKINSNILFYNRRIKNDSTHQKIQGIRRSDTTWNYVNDLNRFKYYKYKNTDTDYILGYNNNINNKNHPTIVSNPNGAIAFQSVNTEYVLYIPRVVKYDESNFITKIVNKDYDYLESELNVNIVTTYNNTKMGSVMYDYVYDATRILNDYYVTTTIEGNEGTDFNLYNGTSFVPLTYTISEQFKVGQSDINVSRNSFFYGGNFNSKVWYNGIFVNGSIILDGLSSTMWKFGIKHNGNILPNKLIPVSTHLNWLGGFHIGNTSTSSVRNVIWYRGYWNGGTWNGGNWLALDLNSQYVSDTWSEWNKGEWYSKYNYRTVRVATTTLYSSGLPTIDGVLLKEGDKVLVKNNGVYTAGAIKWVKDTTPDYTNTMVFVLEGTVEAGKTYVFNKVNSSIVYTAHYSPSIWHGGVWNSDLISNKEFSYQSSEYKFYNLNEGKQIELPVVNSIWLGGEWLRGEWNGGIFVNGVWHSVSTSTTGLALGYETNLGYKYDKTFSNWNGGMMLNSLWEGGTVNHNTSNLDTVFGDITNYDIITQGSDFVWDSTKFKFKLSNNSTNILGKNVFNFNNPTIAQTNSVNRVFSQFNNDGILSVYWRRGEWNGGMFQFSYWENKDINGTDLPIVSVNGNSSTFDSGCFYSSYWKGGLWNNRASTNTPDTQLTNTPNSIFYRSQWEKGYWKADGLTGGTDNIEITDGIFSRSVWNAGVFEGGLFDLSIWRSGVTSNVNLTYQGTTTALTTAIPTGKNYTFAVNSTYTPTTMIGNPTSTSYTNDASFITSIDSIIGGKKMRYLGAVDNLASIWVNGTMRGSVWHGGVWQRGNFVSRNISSIDQYDFFDDSENNTIMSGVWVRGLWLSGYFSAYDDTNVIGQPSSYGTTYEYLNKTNGDRCLFMGIKANAYTNEIDWDVESMLAISKSKMTDELSSTNLTTNNPTSMFSRTMLTSSGNKYFTIFNGIFMNGIIFDSTASTNVNRPILSIFSSLGEYFYKVNTYGVISTDGVNAKFVKDIKVAKSNKLMTLFVPSDVIYPLYYDSTWKAVDSSNASVGTYLTNTYNGKYYNASVDWLRSIWRRDGTIGDGLPSPSILQGIGFTEIDYTSLSPTEITNNKP